MHHWYKLPAYLLYPSSVILNMFIRCACFSRGMPWHKAQYSERCASCASAHPTVFLFMSYCTTKHQAKKNPNSFENGFYIKSLAISYFHMDKSTLSSALSGFTSEFEMGSGGSRSLWSPSNLCWSTSLVPTLWVVSSLSIVSYLACG